MTYKFLQNVSIKDDTELSNTVKHINSIQPNISKDSNIWNDIPFKFQRFVGTNKVATDFLCNFKGNIEVSGNNYIEKSDLFAESDTGDKFNQIVFDSLTQKYKVKISNTKTIILGSTAKIISYDYNSGENWKSYLIEIDGAFYVWIKKVGVYYFYQIKNTKQFITSNDGMKVYHNDGKQIIPKDGTNWEQIPTTNLHNEYLRETLFVPNILSEGLIREFKTWMKTTSENDDITFSFYFSVTFFDKNNTFNILFNKYDGTTSDTFCVNYVKFVYSTEEILSYDEYKNKHLFLNKGDLIKYNGKTYKIPYTIDFKSNRRWYFKQLQLGNMNIKSDKIGDNGGVYFGIIPGDISNISSVSASDVKLYGKTYKDISDKWSESILSELFGVDSTLSSEDYQIFINGIQINNDYFIKDDSSLIKYQPKDYQPKDYQPKDVKKTTNETQENLSVIPKYSTIVIYRKSNTATEKGDGDTTFDSDYYGLENDIEIDNFLGEIKGGIDVVTDGATLNMLKSLVGLTRVDTSYETFKRLFETSDETSRITICANGNDKSMISAIKNDLTFGVINSIITDIDLINEVFTDFRYEIKFNADNFTFDFIYYNQIPRFYHLRHIIDNDFENSISKLNYSDTINFNTVSYLGYENQTFSTNISNIKGGFFISINKNQYHMGLFNVEHFHVIQPSQTLLTQPNSILSFGSIDGLQEIGKISHVEIVNYTRYKIDLILFGNKTMYYSGVILNNSISSYTLTEILPPKNIIVNDNTKQYKIYKFNLGDGDKYWKREKYYFKEIKLPSTIKQLDFESTDLEVLTQSINNTKLKKKKSIRRSKTKIKPSDTMREFILVPAIAMVLVKSSDWTENEIKAMPCLIKIRYGVNNNQDYSYWDSLIKGGTKAIKDIYMEDVISASDKGESNLNYYLFSIYNINHNVKKMRPFNINKKLHPIETNSFYDVMSGMETFIDDIENLNLYHYTVKNKQVKKSIEMLSRKVKLSNAMPPRWDWFGMPSDDNVFISHLVSFSLVDITLRYDDKVTFEVAHDYNFNVNLVGKKFEYQSNEFKTFYSDSKDYIVLSNREIYDNGWNTVCYTKLNDDNFIGSQTNHLIGRVEFENCICMDGTENNDTKITSADEILSLTENKIISNTTSFRQIPFKIDGTMYVLKYNGKIRVSRKVLQGSEILGVYDSVQQMNY